MSSRSVGNLAEERAAQFLQRQGYRVLERNFTCRVGEVDIVAEDGDVLCFVEVRSRATSRYGDAAESITALKRHRIALAARFYLMRRRIDERACRFDVVTIDGNAEPKLLRDAFDLSR